MSKADEPLSYFDMDLKGVYKLNKTAHLRLQHHINKLEKQQERSLVRMDHDIRETKRHIAQIENEKNKLVMKLLKSYVQKTTQKKPKSTKIPESRSGVNTGFTFSTYLDLPPSSDHTASHARRPVSIHFPARNDLQSRVGSIREGKAMSEFGLPLLGHQVTRKDIQTRTSNRSDTRRRDNVSRVSNRTKHSSRREDLSRVSSRHATTTATKVSELAATRGQMLGHEQSEKVHIQKVKEMLGGNTCLYRGHPPARGYNVNLTPRDKGILPPEIQADDYVKPVKLLERIKIFGNVKLPSIIKKQSLEEIDNKSTVRFHGTRLKPTLPPILSSMASVNIAQENE